MNESVTGVFEYVHWESGINLFHKQLVWQRPPRLTYDNAASAFLSLSMAISRFSSELA
jgi:hypothetical protein